MPPSLDRAREDLRAGRAWKARDRLVGALRDRQDPELLDLLATVHHEMRDLPAAGALWFVTGRDDAVALEALAAWRERHGNDQARWLSISGPIRAGVSSARLRDLEEAAERKVAGHGSQAQGATRQVGSWKDRLLGVVAVAIPLWLLAMVLIGTWTVLRWVLG